MTYLAAADPQGAADHRLRAAGIECTFKIILDIGLCVL